MELLTINKDVKGLGKYVGEHILLVLNITATQTVTHLVHILKSNYGKTSGWIGLKGSEYDNEDKFLLATEEIQSRTN